MPYPLNQQSRYETLVRVVSFAFPSVIKTNHSTDALSNESPLLCYQILIIKCIYLGLAMRYLFHSS